jgi:Spy/CpxP family protein refolding chaperone
MLKQSTIILLSLLSVSSIAAAHQNEVRHGLKPLLKQLDLTEVQKQDLRQLMKESKPEIELDGQDRKAFTLQIMQVVHAETFDQAAAKTLIENHQQLRAEKRLVKAQKQHRLFHTLTDVQQAKFVSLLEDREDRSRADRSRKMFKKLGLSDQQKASIKQIKVSNKANKNNAKETLQARRQAEFNIIKAEQFDSDAWQAIQDQYQQSDLQIGLQKAEIRNQVWNQLTDEQQQKAIARMNKIKQKRQARHNAI